MKESINTGLRAELQSAFGQLHAGESLKASVKSYVMEKTAPSGEKSRNRVRFSLALAGVFLVLLGIAGIISYRIPVAAVSVDINPSVELQVNLYDRVIDAAGYNEDGEKFLSELELLHMKYEEAVDTMIKHAEQDPGLKDGVMEITVAGNSDKAEEKMQENLSALPAGKEHVYCLGGIHHLEKAHHAGLSFGKYRAFLELQEEEPDVTEEEVKNLTMREIRCRIDQGCHSSLTEKPEEEQQECCPEAENTTPQENSGGCGHHGHRKPGHRGNKGCRK